LAKNNYFQLVANALARYIDVAYTVGRYPH
jgi:hypothetical protein